MKGRPLPALRTISAIDAVDGSSRLEIAIEVGAVRTSHDSEEPGHANDYDRWSRYREVSVSGSWRRCEWQRGFLSPAQAALCSDVLSEAAAVPDRHRGLCVIALLVTRTS